MKLEFFLSVQEFCGGCSIMLTLTAELILETLQCSEDPFFHRTSQSSQRIKKESSELYFPHVSAQSVCDSQPYFGKRPAL